MLSDNEYAELLERLRYELSPKPEFSDGLPDIRSVAEFTQVYIQDGTHYMTYIAVAGKWYQYGFENSAGNIIDIVGGSVIQDFFLELGKGNITGHRSENKFGLVSNADANVLTDVWDAPAQPVWLAPTASRVHNIVSSSGNDTLLGSGARTVQIWGLQTWDSKESTEIIEMAGATPVPTVNSYVIIHRMEVISTGSAIFTPNLGTITATAVTDATITARVGIGKGQTMMAIYGIPSSQVAYMTAWSASLARSSPQGAEAGVIIRKSTDIENNPQTFTFKHTGAIKTDGTTSYPHPFKPYKRFDGPCIIKMSFTAKDNDTHGDASFDLILVDK